MDELERLQWAFFSWGLGPKKLRCCLYYLLYDIIVSIIAIMQWNA